MDMQGRRIGPYELGSRLGSGGMGEVYRARDAKLGRDVAIKVLPQHVLRDEERLSRFVREARVLAALNHPNIGAIYGLEESLDASESQPTPAIVLELIDGDTLADRLARQRMPIEEALHVAAQIASALEAAHEKGIIHRDLKPANIMITRAGTAKVLDFGLAKVAIPGASQPDLSQSPTQTVEGTHAGTILGTAPYMSPEQARGGVVDKRADIWAFGCVLYELLTGRSAFGRATMSDIIAAVLEREPDWTALPKATPPKVRELLRRCLQKDAARRLHDIADARIEIEDARLVRTHATLGPRAWSAIGAIATLALLIIAFLWVRIDRPTPPSSLGWEQITNFPDAATQPALSPDGRMLAFIRGSGTSTTEGQIYVKPLPDGEPVALTNDRMAKSNPVFSPDGTRVAYEVVYEHGMGWNTWIVPTLRGDARLWLQNAAGLSWIDKDQLLFSRIKQGQHMAIVTGSEPSGQVRDVYVPPHENGMAHRSSVAPDNKSVLVVEMDEGGVWIPCRLVPIDGSSRGRPVGPLKSRCTSAAWAPDGRTMYFAADVGDGFHLWRQAYPDGAPEQLTSAITQEEGIAVAPDGKSLLTSVGLRRRANFLRPASGEERQVPAEGYAFWPLFSGDGKTLCYRVLRGSGTGQTPAELWMMDVASGRSERLLPGQLVTAYDLSRDGGVVAAVREADGSSRIWLAWLDGREPPRRIPDLTGDNPRFLGSDEIVFRAQERGTMFFFRVGTNGTGLQKVAATEGVTSVISSTSPDGKWLTGIGLSAPGPTRSRGTFLMLYSTNGETAVPVFPHTAARIRWSADGRRVYFSVQAGEASGFAVGLTYALPLEEGTVLPPIPEGGFRSHAELAKLPGVQVYPHGDFAAGPSPEIYAFSRETVTRNLYRIPLP